MTWLSRIRALTSSWARSPDKESPTADGTSRISTKKDVETGTSQDASQNPAQDSKVAKKSDLSGDNSANAKTGETDEHGKRKNNSTPRRRLSSKNMFPRASSNWKPPTSRESFEMVKRRVKVPVAMFDRPLTSEIEFIIDVRYHSVKIIGSGSFGVVASAVDSKSGHRIAIKKILNAFSSIRMARYVLREVRLLHHLRHPNIVKLLDIDVPRQYRAWDEVYIVSPLLSTDLRSAMNDRLLKDSNAKKRIAYHMLRALEHMHSLGLMHRDVKSRNLLLDKEMNTQLCDLGHSRFYSKANRDLDVELDAEDSKLIDEPELTGAVTTMNQCPPEISLGAPYDVSVDIWAAGCVIAEIVHPTHESLFTSGAHTAKQSHLQQIIQVVGEPTDDDLKGLPEHGAWYAKISRKLGISHPPASTVIAERLGQDPDPQVVDLLGKMLLFAPWKRISAAKALQHPWFDDVREDVSFDREAYDFATSEPTRRATKADMKNLVWEEVVAFHPEAPSLGVR